MEKDKVDFEGGDEQGGEGNEQAPRARNRTVLLTPDITTQVRARIAQEGEMHRPVAQVPHPSPENGHGTGGFVPVGRRGPAEAASAMRAKPAVEQPKFEAPAEPEQQGIVWVKLTPIVGFLVSFDKDENGEYFVLRSGRVAVTSERPRTGSYLLINDSSISSQHAILRVTDSGEIQVLDQLSEVGTVVKRFGADEEIRLSGDKCSVDHGDVLTFGERSFHVCVLAQSE